MMVSRPSGIEPASARAASRRDLALAQEPAQLLGLRVGPGVVGHQPPHRDPVGLEEGQGALGETANSNGRSSVMRVLLMVGCHAITPTLIAGNGVPRVPAGPTRDRNPIQQGRSDRLHRGPSAVGP